MTEDAIQKAMRALDLTREEAIEMLREDEDIDRGANPHPLTPEQEKASKAARTVSTGPRKTTIHRERKPDADKREILSVLDDALCDLVDDVTVTNPERQLDFVYNDKRYRIILSAPRK